MGHSTTRNEEKEKESENEWEWKKQFRMFVSHRDGVVDSKGVIAIDSHCLHAIASSSSSNSITNELVSYGSTDSKPVVTTNKHNGNLRDGDNDRGGRRRRTLETRINVVGIEKEESIMLSTLRTAAKFIAGWKSPSEAAPSPK